LFNEANKSTDYVSKANALDFFNDVKKIYKAYAKKDYKSLSSSTTTTKSSNLRDAIVSEKTSNQSTTTSVSSKNIFTENVSVASKDNEASAAPASRARGASPLTASLILDSDDDFLAPGGAPSP
jgi:hypothetical protein